MKRHPQWHEHGGHWQPECRRVKTSDYHTVDVLSAYAIYTSFTHLQHNLDLFYSILFCHCHVHIHHIHMCQLIHIYIPLTAVKQVHGGLYLSLHLDTFVLLLRIARGTTLCDSDIRCVSIKWQVWDISHETCENMFICINEHNSNNM